MHCRALVLLAFCAVIIAGIIGPDTNVEAQTGSLDAEFEAAAKKYEVLKELLLAMGYVNTRWEMPPPEASDHEEKEPPRPGGVTASCSSSRTPPKIPWARRPR